MPAMYTARVLGRHGFVLAEDTYYDKKLAKSGMKLLAELYPGRVAQLISPKGDILDTHTDYGSTKKDLEKTS